MAKIISFFLVKLRKISYLCNRYTCIQMGKELIKPDYIFESSWEVCNKVGGIYTVLSTRAKTLQESMKDQIIFIAQTNRLAQAEEYKSMIEERFHPK